MTGSAIKRILDAAERVPKRNKQNKDTRIAELEAALEVRL